MKTVIKKIAKAASIAAMGVMLVAGSAMATQITGSINFFGNLTLNGTNFNDSTFIDFQSPLLVADGFGDYDGTAGTSVDFTDFTYRPSLVPLSDALWSFTYNTKKYAFSLITITGYDADQLTGSGTLTIDGFDPTEGIWKITTQNVDPKAPRLSFSAASAPIPEPGTMLLLGSGLIGLAVYGKRRMRS